MVRYIHSGDKVEAGDKQSRHAQQQPEERKGDAAQPEAAGGVRMPDAEFAAEPGALTRPIAGGAESPTGLDTGTGDADGETEAQAAESSGEENGGDGSESSGMSRDDATADSGTADGESSADDRPADDGPANRGSADNPSADREGQDSESADDPTADREGQDSESADDASADSRPDGSESEQEPAGGGIKGFFSSLFGDEAEPGQESGAEAATGSQDGQEQDTEAGADIGVDSGATGYGDHDLQASDGAGTPGQEGAAKADSSSPSQDTEASDELGAEPQEKSHKGFFARLFSDDEDAADEEEETSGTDQIEVRGDGQGNKEEQSAKQKDPAQAEGSKAKKSKQEAASSGKPKDLMQQKRDNERSDSLEQSILYWQGNDKIPPALEDTRKTLTEVMGLGSSFDIVFREMSFAGKRAALLCISGFAKDTIIDEILKRLTYLTPDNVSTDVFASFLSEYIPHVQVEKGDLLSESVNKVLSGMSVLFIEGETQVIVMDTRSYPSRSPDEPSIERVVRGARDGFTETLLSNVALVRRRVRDPGLKFEMHQIGRRTRTDVCLAYIDDIVDKTQVQAVTDKLKSVDIDGIPLADKQLEEAIVGGGWNPYPLVRYSERPDIVASHLLEGRVVIFVDTSPSVMVLPTTFFDLCQHAEENRQTPFMGSYLRWVRFLGIFASMFLLPLWMLMVIHPELKPAILEFIGPQKSAKIPLIAQFLIVELGVDLLRMAAVHTPTPLGSAMGLIAAILVGDIAVQTGLFVNEVVLYMAVASIGMFATPSYELGLANRIVRLALLLAVAAFQVPGFMIGTTLLVVLLTTHRSYNSPYMWPFIPFNAKAMGSIILRQPVLSSKTRPSFNKTRDNTRMPPAKKKKQKS